MMGSYSNTSDNEGQSITSGCLSNLEGKSEVHCAVQISRFQIVLMNTYVHKAFCISF